MCTRLETMTQILLTAFEELTPNECFHSFCDFTRRGLANDSDLVTLLESLIQHNRIDIQMCLMPMIHCSKPQLVDVLLANNVNVHRGGPNGLSPIVQAVINAHNFAWINHDMNHIIRRLVETDKNLLETTWRGRNLMYLGWSRDHKLEQVELLLDLGIDINMLSLRQTRSELDLYATNNTEVEISHFSMLFLAVAEGEENLFDLLIRRGANPNVRAQIHDSNPTKWLTLLNFTIFYTNTNSLERAEALLRAGANVDDRDAEGCTCLWYAVANNMPMAIIDLLLQFGANPNAKNKMQYGGRSPMDIANAPQRAHILDVVRERRLVIFNQMNVVGIPREIQENFLMPLQPTEQ